MDDAFKLLEELVVAPEKKRRVLTPEQKARKAEYIKKYRAEKKARDGFVSKRIFDGRGNQRAKLKAWHKKTAARSKDKQLFAISQAIRAAGSGVFKYDITEFCEEPIKSKLQYLIDKVKKDNRQIPEVLELLRNMRELRKLELAEQQQATETETEN